MPLFRFATTALAAVLLIVPRETQATCSGTSVFINEIHYDNTGADTGEFVEIAGPAGTDLEDWELVLYNGSNGAPYRNITIPQVTLADTTTTGFGFYVISYTGIQNGAPDGMVLVDDAGNIFDMLAYEGSLVATDGVAKDLTLNDIGVSETSSTDVGDSLQRTGSGSCAEDFTWAAPQTETPGAANAGQTFGSVVVSPTSTPTVTPPPECPADGTPITAIQGTGSSSPLEGQVVTVCEAIVTATVSNGFYIQQGATPSRRSLASTSGPSGIFVFTDGPPTVSIADLVTVRGEVDEFFGTTQLTDIDFLHVVSQGVALPEPVALTLPLASVDDFESFEGMLVSVHAAAMPSKSLVVSEFFNFDRFGEFKVCAADDTLGRVFQYTQLNEPDQAGFTAASDLFDRSCVTIDDSQSVRNPDPVLIGGVYDISSENTMRGGSVVDKLVGPLTYSFGEWRVNPQSQDDLLFVNRNLGREQLELEKLGKNEVRLVSTNLLNFFTSIDTTGNTPFRGADNIEEYNRQAEKMVLALNEMDADMFGVVEIENIETNTAVSAALAQLNRVANAPEEEKERTRRLGKSSKKKQSRCYTAVSVEAGLGLVGDDAIKNDIIYDRNALKLIGSATLTDGDVSQALLDETEDNCIFACRSRVPVAATFEVGKGRVFTVVVNHFKSKGPSGVLDESPNADQGDGAGNWNLLRKQSSQALLEWISTNPTGVETGNIILMGDFNSYAKEDPVTEILDNGYGSVEPLSGVLPPVYSYVFSGQWGTLDYIFATPCLLRGLVEVQTWHVNADEPDLFDYNTDFGRNKEYFDGTVPWRFSDHDPLIASFEIPNKKGACV